VPRKEDELFPLIKRLYVVQSSPFGGAEKHLAVPSLPQVPDIDTVPASLFKPTALAINGWILVYRFERCIELVEVLQHGAGKGMLRSMR
jgi:hypothetical protein